MPNVTSRLTPAALADIRRRYFETDESARSIGRDYGANRNWVYRLARREGWPLRKERPARDVPPDLKLELEAEKAVRAEIAGASNAPAQTVADRLEQAVEKELAAVELRRATLGPEPMAPADAERTVRTLERLTETLFKVRRLRLPESMATGQVALSDMPKDIDEFRHALARRIEAFVRSRADARVSSPGKSG